MKAIEFSNRFATTVTDFFSRCLENEAMPLHKIQSVTVCNNDKGFELRLETAEASFSQEFEMDEKEITPLYFETH